MKQVQILKVFAITFLAATSLARAASIQNEALVFAAASLREVMTDSASAFEKIKPGKIQFNFAGSNVLAQQINAGATADLFISANEEWVAAVEKTDRAELGTRKVLFTNQLAIISNSAATWTISKPEDLATTPFRFLSIGDPKAVPAGKYAKAFLEGVKIGKDTLWNRVEKRVAPGADVRVALSVVEADPTIVGIVYQTDAKTSAKVKILYEIAATESKPVEYFLTKVKLEKTNSYVEKFLDFLGTSDASKIFIARGFILPTK